MHNWLQAQREPAFGRERDLKLPLTGRAGAGVRNYSLVKERVISIANMPVTRACLAFADYFILSNFFFVLSTACKHAG
jgi:hypothetical protein